MSEFCTTRPRKDWFAHREAGRGVRWEKYDNDYLSEYWEMPGDIADVCAVAEAERPLELRFQELASRWSRATAHISSIEDLVSHPDYQAIIDLGWDVVPLLLLDLQRNRRFWFPALNTITKVRPFDHSEAGNGRRMTNAWIRWGKRKGLI